MQFLPQQLLRPYYLSPELCQEKLGSQSMAFATSLTSCTCFASSLQSYTKGPKAQRLFHRKKGVGLFPTAGFAIGTARYGQHSVFFMFSMLSLSLHGTKYLQTLQGMSRLFTSLVNLRAISQRSEPCVQSSLWGRRLGSMTGLNQSM